MPIRANTIFSTDKSGIIREPLDRSKGLNAEQQTYIENQTRELRQAVLREVEKD